MTEPTPPTGLDLTDDEVRSLELNVYGHYDIDGLYDAAARIKADAYAAARAEVLAEAHASLGEALARLPLDGRNVRGWWVLERLHAMAEDRQRR